MGHSALNKVLVFAFVLALVLQSSKRVANTSWEIGISLAHILFCIFKVSTNHKTSAAEREKKSTVLELNLFFKSVCTSFKIRLNICLWPTGRTLQYCTIQLTESVLIVPLKHFFLPQNTCFLLTDCLSAVGSQEGRCNPEMLQGSLLASICLLSAPRVMLRT